MIEPGNYHVFKEGVPTMYQTGLALIGGWATHLYDHEGEKLVAATFDTKEDAESWGGHMVSEDGVFPSPS